MKYQSSFPRIAVALLGTCLLLGSCGRRIKVPDGPNAVVTIPCSQKVTDILTPSTQCITVVASTKNKCDIVVTISCGEVQGQTATIAPGKQAILCCPEGSQISRIDIECKSGSGNCRYYIVGHAPGAALKKKCFN